MSAAPHLMVRARRWLDAHLLRIRVQQLTGLIAQIERGIDADCDELAAARMALHISRNQLQMLDGHPTRRLERTPCR